MQARSAVIVNLFRAGVAPPSLVIAVVLLTISIPYFATLSNAATILGAVGPLAVAAVGEMLVIVTGGFDISVGAVAALGSVMAALTINVVGPVGLVAAPATGAGCGILSGFLISRLSVQPVIATLGTMLAARGLSLALGGGYQTIELGEGNDVLWLGYGRILGIPLSFLIVIGMTIAATLFLDRLRAGRRLMMIGSNATSAELVGVPVVLSIMTAYALCGLLAGLAGMIFVGRASAGLPTEGYGLELQAIAAAVMGGTALSGGMGWPPFVLIGALFIQTMVNGLNLAGLSPFVVELATGGVIVFAGLLDLAIRRFAAAQLKHGG
jgi:ribose/xylose/arabinose/galactoside ABC-type transport system permease subunit